MFSKETIDKRGKAMCLDLSHSLHRYIKRRYDMMQMILSDIFNRKKIWNRLYVHVEIDFYLFRPWTRDLFCRSTFMNTTDCFLIDKSSDNHFFHRTSEFFFMD